MTAFAIESEVREHQLYMAVCGLLDPASCTDVLNEAERLAAQTGRRQLVCDHRRARLQLTAAQLRARLERFTAGPLQKLRVAVVSNVKSNEYVFLEASAALLGIPLRVYTDMAQAERWLAQH